MVASHAQGLWNFVGTEHARTKRIGEYGILRAHVDASTGALERMEGMVVRLREYFFRTWDADLASGARR